MRRLAVLLRQNRSFLILLLGFGLIRTAVADYNPIPSGSMHPNILEGDVVLVNRLAYNVKVPLTDIIVARLAEPARGDIVTFTSPQDGRRLIKRIIGLPGDRIAMHDKRLTINGEALAYVPVSAETDLETGGRRFPARQLIETADTGSHFIQWLDGVRNATEFGPIVIPADRYLMLGDNRDNSADSRYIGLVSRERLTGRAERILVSVDMTGNWLPRFARFGQSLYR